MTACDFVFLLIAVEFGKRRIILFEEFNNYRLLIFRENASVYEGISTFVNLAGNGDIGQ